MSKVADAGGAARAGFVRRAIARLVDELVVLPLAFVVLFVISLYALDAGGVDDIEDVGSLELLIQLLFFVIHVVYWTVFRAHGRRTAGKLIVGAVVVSDSTYRGIGYGRAVLREIMTLISLLPCGLGFLWAIWDADHQTFHDKIVRTLVVEKADLTG